jgi:hypothetical protein
MRIFKTSIIMFAAAALFLTPLFAHAQTAAPQLTSEMVTRMWKLEAEIIVIRQGLPNGTQAIDSQEYVSKVNEAKTACENIDRVINSISSNAGAIGEGSWSAKWMGESCAYGMTYMVSEARGVPQYGFKESSSVALRIQSVGFGTTGTYTKEEFNKNAKTSQTAENNQIYSKLSRWILNPIIVGVGNLIASVLAFLVTAALALFDTVIKYTTQQSMPSAVTTVWGIVRDVMNMLFIIAIIAMSLGTILQRSDLNYKQLLPKLIISALLINFSYPIAILLINISDSLIRMLAPSMPLKELGKTVFQGFITNGNGAAGFLGWDTDTLNAIPEIIAKLVSLVFLTVGVLLMTALMVIRLVGLWFIVMLSPAYFGLQVLPFTRGRSEQIKDLFIKYLIWGPVTVFFLRVSFIFIIQSKNSNIIPPNEQWMSYVLISGFMMAGFYAAKGSGMIGASTINKYADDYWKKGSRFVPQMYGNLFWRGTAPGAIAGAAGYATGLAKSMKSGTSILPSHAEAKKEAGKWFTRTRDSVGNVTAAIENEPRRQIDEWVNKPNKEREKLVKKEARRTEIRRNYLKDLDEDTAKKFSPTDLAYMIETGNYNEAKLNNILEHGNQHTKLTLARAFKAKLIKQEKLGNDPKAFNEVFKKTREAAWVARGRRKSDLDHNPNFMADPNNISDNDIEVVEKQDFKKDPTFSGQIKNSYTHVDRGDVHQNKAPKNAPNVNPGPANPGGPAGGQAAGQARPNKAAKRRANVNPGPANPGGPAGGTTP